MWKSNEDKIFILQDRNGISIYNFAGGLILQSGRLNSFFIFLSRGVRIDTYTRDVIKSDGIRDIRRRGPDAKHHRKGCPSDYEIVSCSLPYSISSFLQFADSPTSSLCGRSDT